MPLLAPDRQDTWAPAWLLELTPSALDWMQSDMVQEDFIQADTSTAATKFASRDLSVAGTPYHGRIMDEPTVERQFVNTFWGWTEVSRLTLRLANADNALDSLYSTDIRGTPVVLKRYDVVTATTITEFTGTLTDAALGLGHLEITAADPDLSAFERPVPNGVVEATTFPRAVDLGQTLAVIFGNVVRHRLLYVNDEVAANVYDYLVGRGSLAVTAVYRKGPNDTLHLVGASEYTVETTRYTGFTTIRFTIRQVDFNNAFHVLYADVTGLAAERNFARAVKTLLSDADYGLGLPVDATSFTTAEADLDAVGGLLCDGAMTEQRAAQDVLRELLIVRGMRLGRTSTGSWTCTVDTQQTNTRMALRDGPGSGERNLLGVGQRRRPSSDQAVRDYILRFRHDTILPESRLEVRRNVHLGYGRDVIVHHAFIRDTTTADKVVHYLAKRELYGSETLDVQVTQEGRQLQPGELVTVTYAPLAISGTTWEVRQISKTLDRVRCLLGTWSSGFYDYTAGTLPTDISVPTPAVIASLGDTTAPDAATAIAARQAGGKIIEVDVTHTAPPDWGTTRLYRSTSTSTGPAAEIERKKAKRFHDQNISYGQQYTYWASVADLSCNESALSPGASATPAEIDTPDILSNAVSILQEAVGPAGETFLTNNDSTFLSMTSTVLGGAQLVMGRGKFRVYSTASISVGLDLYRGATKLDGVAMSYARSTDVQLVDDSVIVVDLESPSTGTFNYYLSAVQAGFSSTSLVSLLSLKLWRTEFRR